MSDEPALLPDDPEKRVVDVIYSLTQTLPDLAGFTVSTVQPAGVSPRNYIRARSIGGIGEGMVADRVRVDVMVWCDGTIATESKRNRTARLLMAHLRQKLRAKIFASPVPLPDPADATKTFTLFTIELFLRGRSA